MASIKNKPDISATMPGLAHSGVQMLNAITAKKIWAESVIHYGFGGADTLSFDKEFARAYKQMFGKNAYPDDDFFFADLTERAFTMIDAVTRLDFQRTDQLDVVDLVITSTSDKPRSSTEGFFEFPGSSTHEYADGYWSIGAFNSGLNYLKKKAELGGGEYANWTIIHEIGHSLGLKHTHKESNGKPLDTLGKHLDNEKYSVMSYNPASDPMNHGHAVSMMALDIASLQALYGAEDYATGNSTYTFTSARSAALNLDEGNVTIGRAFYCIWDSGGEDTIRFGGGNESVLINLNAATLNTGSVSSDLRAIFADIRSTDLFKSFSSQLRQEIVDQWHHAGGFFSQVLVEKGGKYKGEAGGFSIAHGAVIENAVGGNGNDMLIGNSHANRLDGNGGNDVLHGGAGNDVLHGHAGKDILFGGAGNDVLDGGARDDVLEGGAGADRFVFSKGYGLDVIVDFTHGEDIIDLRGLGAFRTFTDLESAMWEEDEFTVIEVGADMLALYAISISELTASDFWLV